MPKCVAPKNSSMIAAVVVMAETRDEWNGQQPCFQLGTLMLFCFTSRNWFLCGCAGIVAKSWLFFRHSRQLLSCSARDACAYALVVNLRHHHGSEISEVQAKAKVRRTSASGIKVTAVRANKLKSTTYGGTLPLPFFSRSNSYLLCQCL